MNKKKILITSALPYANGPLHFGHIAGAYLPADCYARFQRLKGHDVLYICGSDEHGVAITLSADIAKRAPKEHVDIFHAQIKGFFEQLNFHFDHYSRTTWEGHVATTQEFFKDLLENGYIEERVTEQLFSEQDKRFLADRYVVGTCPKCHFPQARGDECGKCGASFEATDLLSPRSKLTSAPLVLKPTKHWFLRFDLFKDKLKEWIDKKEWKANVLNFAKSYIDDLRPRAITRDSDWGIPVPLESAKGKVFYVWFDAPIGYISATREWAEKKGTPDAWKDYWCDDQTKYVQFIGKDNIPFHAVFFPAMIMGQNQPYKLVDELPANEFYNLEGRQFSKSEGWYIDLEKFFKKFSVDQARYAIAANAPESQDAEFTWKDFQMRCNSELLGKLGNLVNRVLVFASQHCQAKIPGDFKLDDQDAAFLLEIKQVVQEIEKAFEGFHLRKACQLIMELAQCGNVYFNAKKPWALAKNPETLAQMRAAVFCCLECIKCLAIVSSPVIPETAQKMWHLLGYKTQLINGTWDDLISTPLDSHQNLPPPAILFSKIEDEMIEQEMKDLNKLAEEKNAPAVVLKEQISIDDAKKLDLRVAEILSAERVPKSKKLLKLSMDLGFEKRTVVAGIGDKIEALETLIGKRVIIVANLKPATLMGIESQGMLLATESDGKIILPDLSAAALGSSVS